MLKTFYIDIRTVYKYLHLIKRNSTSLDICKKITSILSLVEFLLCQRVDQHFKNIIINVDIISEKLYNPLRNVFEFDVM